ncbi:mitochondrial antiviral-signaling protein isoform X2 [Pleurodeles waltl]|uniref:mitochondrial antiviral-signaling protein isoform X2 n=1 Tax=Pleurodeles waltl TaxID=8319 RepID=UPI003709B777
MGFAEDKMWDYVLKHLSDFHSITFMDVLDYLAGCLTTADMEGIKASLRNQGNQRSTYEFLDALRRRKDWVNELIRALRACRHEDLADRLQLEYDAHQPRGSRSPNNSNQFSISGATSPQPSLLSHSINTPPSYSSLPPTFAPARLIQPSFASPATLPSQHTPERVTSMPEPPPPYHSEPYRNSSTSANPPGLSSQTPTDDSLTELKVPVPETQLEGRPSSTSSTQANDNGSGDVASNCALPPESTPVRPRAPAIATDPEPAVRRKEPGFPTKQAPVERSDDHMAKVTENVSNQLSTNPVEGTPNSKNSFGRAVRSQIPRKVIPLTSNEPLNKTSSAATREEHPPECVQTRNHETGTGKRRNERTEPRSEVNRDSGEEEEDHISKPGVLNSQVDPDWNPSTRPLPAVANEPPRSSLHPSDLAISKSTDATSRSTPSLRQPPAVEDPRHLYSPFNQQEPNTSSSDLGSSIFTVIDDPLMISKNSCETESMPSEVNEPEEVDFSSSPLAKGRSTVVEQRVFCSENNVEARSTYPVEVSETFDYGSSIEDTRNYQFHFSNPPTVDNYSANNAADFTPSGSPNSRSNDDGTKGNKVALVHVVLPAIMFAIVGIFVLYKLRRK